MKRLLAVLSIVGLVSSLIAGCGSGGDASSNRFEIFRDGEALQYDSTRIRLDLQDASAILYASNLRDPIPDAADDGYVDFLRVAFEPDAQSLLRTGAAYPISGEVAWSDAPYGVDASQVAFTGSAEHTEAVEHLFFQRQCFGCFCESCSGAQRFEGTLQLSVNNSERLAGVLELQIEGDVPGTWGAARRYDVILFFDQHYPSTDPDMDASVDAGYDGGPDAAVDVDAGTCTETKR